MKKNYLASVPIFLAFLVMGFGDVSVPLTSQLQNDFELNNFQAGLVTFMAGFLVSGLCILFIFIIAFKPVKV